VFNITRTCKFVVVLVRIPEHKDTVKFITGTRTKTNDQHWLRVPPVPVIFCLKLFLKNGYPNWYRYYVPFGTRDLLFICTRTVSTLRYALWCRSRNSARHAVRGFWPKISASDSAVVCYIWSTVVRNVYRIMPAPIFCFALLCPM